MSEFQVRMFSGVNGSVGFIHVRERWVIGSASLNDATSAGMSAGRLISRWEMKASRSRTT
jgi:hypothetical protein